MTVVGSSDATIDALPHAIGRQSWRVEVDDEALALHLRPRLAEWNRERWLPRIEAVLEAFAAPGRRLRVTRLEIDLGSVAAGDDIATIVADRLEEALRRRLTEIFGQSSGQSEDGHSGSAGRTGSIADDDVWLELFEHYVVRGTVPFWAPRRTFRLTALVRLLAERAPRRLDLAVRRHGHRHRALERLVAQLDVATFHELLRVLEPEHAGLLVAYLLDIGDLHRRQPLLPIAGREVERTLGLLTLVFLVTERGSSWNRKAYVKSLIRGLGRSRGCSYGDLLRTFGRILGGGVPARATPGSGSIFRSALPEVVRELLDEWARETGERAIAPPVPWQVERLRAELLRQLGVADAAMPAERSLDPGHAPGGDPELQDLLASLVQHEATARRYFTSLRHRDAERRAVARHSSPEVFEEMLEILRPQEAEALSALVRALGRVPSPYRPRMEAVREAVLLEVLCLGSRRPMGAEVFADILRRLFESPLPAPVARSLDGEISGGAGRLAPASREVLCSAVAAASRKSVKDTVARSQARGDKAVIGDTLVRGTLEKKTVAVAPEGESEAGDSFYVADAGLVLAAPFLPRLVDSLLASKGDGAATSLAEIAGASLAVHTLHYLVTGTVSAPEPELVLGKILCGWPLEAPVCREIVPSPSELELCDSLLASMLANWPGLEGTSADGLRQTFLQREGRLEHSDGAWRLAVERKTVDILMQRLPWSFSVVLLPAMKQPLHVSWT